MIKKLISVLSAAVFMSAVAFGAHAAEKENYDAKSFAAAQAAGKPILVENSRDVVSDMQGASADPE